MLKEPLFEWGTLMSPERVIKILNTRRFDLAREKRTQADIEALLLSAGVEFVREFRFNDENIIDFIIDGEIGLEVKLKAPKRLIYDQCERYTSFLKLSSLILVTNTMMGFPKELNGKPCYLYNLGKAWL